MRAEVLQDRQPRAGFDIEHMGVATVAILYAGGHLDESANPMASPREFGREIRDDGIGVFALAENGGGQDFGGIGDVCAHLRRRMWNVRRSCVVSWRSKASPLSRTRWGISMAASGSVHSTTRSAPGSSLRRTLRVRNAGKGQRKPRRSRGVEVKSAIMRAMR